jgi:UDPglucose 6-dehydrogenase
VLIDIKMDRSSAMNVRYSIIGLGKLGISMAAAIASRGFQVIGVDVIQHTVDLVNNGYAPVKETNLAETIAINRERIHATTNHQEAIINSDLTFVIVPTPSDKRGAFSLQYASWAFKEIGRAVASKNTYHNIVLTSTVLPGSTRYGLLPILEKESGKKCGLEFGLCYSPEFIALGSVIHDFLHPDFTLVGEFDERCGKMLEECYARILPDQPPCQRMSLENAELTKIAINAFVTTKITFANMLMGLCEKIPGADIDIVTNAMGNDRRIGPKYLKGGLGYGGPCFPRDNVALDFMARLVGLEMGLAEATDGFNRSIPYKIVQRLETIVKPGATVALLGLAYKPFSNIIEESQGIIIAKALNQAGMRVIAFDPLACDVARMELAYHAVVFDSIFDCLVQAEIILIVTPDPVFQALKRKDFPRKPITVIDFWRILDKELKDQPGICYIPVGRDTGEKHNAERMISLWEAK